MYIRIILLLTIAVCLSCKKNTIESKTPIVSLPIDIVKSKFPSDKFDIYLNESEDFAIVCSHFPKNDTSGFSTLVLKLYDIKNGEVIFEDRIPKGKSYWFSNEVVAIQSLPGIVKGENEEHSMKKFDVYKRSFLKD